MESGLERAKVIRFIIYDLSLASFLYQKISVNLFSSLSKKHFTTSHCFHAQSVITVIIIFVSIAVITEFGSSNPGQISASPMVVV